MSDHLHPENRRFQTAVALLDRWRWLKGVAAAKVAPAAIPWYSGPELEALAMRAAFENWLVGDSREREPHEVLVEQWQDMFDRPTLEFEEEQGNLWQDLPDRLVRDFKKELDELWQDMLDRAKRKPEVEPEKPRQNRLDSPQHAAKTEPEKLRQNMLDIADELSHRRHDARQLAGYVEIMLVELTRKFNESTARRLVAAAGAVAELRQHCAAERDPYALVSARAVRLMHVVRQTIRLVDEASALRLLVLLELIPTFYMTDVIQAFATCRG